MAYTDKQAEREYQRQHYLKNKDLYKERARVSREKQRKEQREFLREYLSSHPCVDCGNSDIRVLQFDHRDRELKVSSPGQLVGSKNKLMEEIEKCDVRCANCHMIRTAEQFGWTRMA